MRYTLEEKYRYNKRRKSSFSSGYVTGVNLYRDYTKHDEEGKLLTQALVNVSKVRARQGFAYCKGLLCGYRDAADARKNTARKEGIRR